jgi:pyridoxal phosphate enzyme (YggS family)
MEGLAQRLAAVRARIERAAERARRDPGQILLLAVTKIFPAEAIQEAYDLGLREFGENYVQEFESKAPSVGGLAGARFHLIGHLQSNKAAKAAELFQVVQTVDSAKLARRLNDTGRAVEIMLEGKLSEEEAKSGADPGGVPALIEEYRLPDLRLRGVDDNATRSEDRKRRGIFPELRGLADANGWRNYHGDVNDLETAIERSTAYAWEQLCSGRRRNGDRRILLAGSLLRAFGGDGHSRRRCLPSCGGMGGWKWPQAVRCGALPPGKQWSARGGRPAGHREPRSGGVA